MAGDLFPVYCRVCHRQINAGAKVCPHCAQPQGLPPTDDPSTAQPVQSTSPQSSRQQQAPAQSNVVRCPFCATVVTAGDYFCRGCGKPLIPGAGSGDSAAAGKAYGISAILSVVLCTPLGSVVLAFLAIAKGSRGLGCAALVIIAASVLAMVLLGGAIVNSIASYLPGGLLPSDSLVP